MNFRNKVAITCFILGTIATYAQSQNRALTVDDLTNWQRITRSEVADDGSLIAVKHEPWKGDATVLLYDKSGKGIMKFPFAGDFAFTSSSKYIVVEEKTPLAEIEKLKLQKTKRDQMPMDKLVIFATSGQSESIDSIHTFKLSKTTDWLAYKRGNRKDSTLYVRSLTANVIDSIPAVSDFGFAEEGDYMYFVSKGDTTGQKAGIHIYQTANRKQTLILEGKGNFEKVQFNKTGDRIAFLYAEKAEKDSADEKNGFTLFQSSKLEPAVALATKGNPNLPKDWIVSKNGDIRFSKDDNYLFFPTSPQPRERDTTSLAENRPNVQIWSWDESVQHTQQVINRKREANKTYTAAYHLPTQTIRQLNTIELPDLQLPETGDIALIATSKPYGTERMWSGKNKQDVFTIHMQSGETKLLAKANESRMRLSPAGKYASWYSTSDSSWYTCFLKENKIYKLTSPDSFAAWDSENDVPDFPDAYGAAGWSKEDKYLLLYDRYDIWKFNPTGAEQPINLTVNGKEKRLMYRIQPTKKEERFIDLDEIQLLTGFNEESKATGFYTANFKKAAQPKTVLSGSFKATFIAKAKNTNAVIYKTETFMDYPEIRYSDLQFGKSAQLTNLGNQQAGILWGTAELTSWTSLDGKKLEGVIYKPANFDPNKKYPLIVNFYERNSETLYSYRMPEPHRSTVDYHLYNSNGYIIFNPDVRYKDGYPGESCFNSVMPGIASLIEKGYINEKAIGAQGHSWGGYQVAHLATRTDLFAAIESGAPVVNMFSAYGGIRWETGLNRSFQYEHGQSRIGATPWEKPLLYQENSPLFMMDKVNTPILIMHNDADGHVPWYQGIEYFVALKRLQKPVWMLNYTGEPHWPMKMPNRIDFQKRMFQFFEHYLKGAPMPKWMSEGVKAIDQPFELGY